MNMRTAVSAAVLLVTAYIREDNMNNLRKTAAIALALLLALSSAATAFGASRETAEIGGNSGNIVKIDAGSGLRAVLTLGQDSVNKDMPAQDHINKAKEKGGKLIASVNGALFNAYYKSGTLNYPDNCAVTYGTLISEGKVVRGGGDMPLLGVMEDGSVLIDKVKVEDYLKVRGQSRFYFWTVNGYYKDSSAVSLFTREMGYPVNLEPGTVVVRVKGGVVTAVETGLSTLAVPAGDELAVTFNSAAWANSVSWNTQPEVGNTAVRETVYRPDKGTGDWSGVVTAVGCSPWLLQNGQDVFDRNTNTDPKMGKDYKAQRTFAAVNESGELIIGEATCTFSQIIDYLQSKGYKDAMALDGGASSTVYYEGSGFIQPAGRKLTNMIHFMEGGSGTADRPETPISSGASEWAKPYIEEAQFNDLIPEDFNLVPKANITRAEFAALAMQLIKAKIDSDKLTSIIYSKGVSYWDAREALTDTWDMNVIQCYQLGIVAGKGNNKFEPNASITRAEAAVMLTNTAKLIGKRAAGIGLDYVDEAEIGWASQFVDFVTRARIMGSFSSKENRFNPKGLYTQEQAITTFVNLF